MVLFISIPLAEKLYSWLAPKIGKNISEEDLHNKALEELESVEDDGDEKLINLDLSPGSVLSWGKLKRWVVLLLIFSVIVAVGNWIGVSQPILDSFIGMLILSLLTIIGMSLERIISWRIPSLLYISIIGIILAIPGMPTSPILAHYISSIEISSIVTAYLAYVGIAIGNDWDKFKKMSWKGVIITMFVIAGTYYGSATIAQIMLILFGTI